MQIYIVFSARWFSFKFSIYEFFNSKTEAELFIENHEDSKYLEYYYYAELFSSPSFDSGFVKGLNNEIIITDYRLIEYFCRILDYSLCSDLPHSLNNKFDKNLLKSVLNELGDRLDKLELTKP